MQTVGTETRAPLIALAGKPNAGKTALFNRLTGSRATVGNYPGITVERRIGPLRLPNRGDAARALDIPGIYSLSARSADEQIAIRALGGLGGNESPDVVLVVLDGTQLQQNLYLALQIIELDLPTVVAVNMADVLEREGKVLDPERLEADLGVPVVQVSALTGSGIETLRRRLADVLDEPTSARPGWRWQPTDPELLRDIDSVAETLPDDWRGDASEPGGNERRSRALALWALLSVDDNDELIDLPVALRARVNSVQARAQKEGRALDDQVIQSRFGWIEERVARYVRSEGEERKNVTDRIDAVLLSPWLGFPLFLILMGVVFEALFAWADPVIGAIETGLVWFGERLRGVLPDGFVEGLVVDGIVAGVGGVLVFLPQILLLFLFLGLMQDTGYMARVAYLMDRVMRAVGLHGRAFVPMLSGYACAIPAVMATRTMERERDRLLTMLVVPLMTCSARLPVYTLLIAAMYPAGGKPFIQGALMVGLYLFATLTALLVAAVLGRTLLKGPRIPLLLELPPYRLPRWRDVLRQMWERSLAFVKGAGGMILACTIVLWFLLTFPQPDASAVAPDGVVVTEAEATSEALRNSYGGRLGRAIEPVIEPLGFDWEIGIGLIGAFAAREVFVSTMAVVYGLEDSVAEDSPKLRERIASQRWPDGRKVFTPLVCLSLLVFFALACQCMSTLAAVKRETGGWKWPVFLFGYTLVLAWGSSFAIYQGGRLLGFT